MKVLHLETSEKNNDNGWFIDATTRIVAIANWQKFVVSLGQNKLSILTKHTSS